MPSTPTSNRSTGASTPRTGANPALLIGVMVALLAIVAIAVFATAGGDEPDADGVSQFGIVTVEGDLLPPLGDGADGAVGMTAPSVVSERPEGVARLEPAESGRPTMTVFLAHWCPHCQRELPQLVDLADVGAFDDIDTVAVLTATTSSRDNFPPSAWLDTEGWTGTAVYDDETSSAGQAYGLSGFPMLVFTDADGTVVERLSGEQPDDVIEAAVAAATGS